MAAARFVAEESQIVENVRTFARELDRPQLREMTAYVRHWYAVEEPDGRWFFAPSKFIGYAGMTAKEFGRIRETLDGRATENNLKQWFVELEPGSRKEEVLKAQLRQMIAKHGKTPNRLARIHVLKGSGVDGRAPRQPAGESWRITSDPEILAGKPCIRGIRIRVADILEMLAQGATRQEILADFPYLEDGDITAALEFAMGAVDHRLVKAA